MNSGPLAQGSVRYGLAHLDSVTVGFRGSHGAAVVAAGCSPPGATGSPGKFSGVSTRRIAFTVMLVMSVVAAALAGMLYAGRLESGRYQWGTGYELSVIAAVILVGTGIGLGSVIGLLFGSLLIGMINTALSSRASASAAAHHGRPLSSSSRSRWREGNDG